METQHGLARAVLNSSSFLPISSAEYDRLALAKEFLLEVLAFEEKFDVVLGNYLEFEQTLNNLGTEYMIRQDYEYHALSDARVLVNRLVQNLLGACRVYLDHGAHHAAKIQSLVPSFASEFELLTHVQYDGNSSYRICEALRNHAQHRGFVVSTVSVGASRADRTGRESVLLYRVGADVDMEAVSESPKTKPIVLEDLKELGKSIDVRPLLREYVGCLSSVHEAVRARANVELSGSEAAIVDAFERFGEAFPEESAVALAAVERYADGRWIRRTILSKNLGERRRLLCRRNPSLVGLGQRHVSSEPRQ